MSQANTITMTVKLDPKIKEHLQKLGHIKQRSVHWLMKQAITGYLAQEQYNEELRQETIARWQEVEQGKTVSHAEVVSWLNGWGTEAEIKKPICPE